MYKLIAYKSRNNVVDHDSFVRGNKINTHFSHYIEFTLSISASVPPPAGCGGTAASHGIRKRAKRKVCRRACRADRADKASCVRAML